MDSKLTPTKNALQPTGRFAASGGVSRPTVCGILEVLSPVRAFVSPPPASSRLDVSSNFKERHEKIY